MPKPSPSATPTIKSTYVPWANRERQVGQAYVHRSPAKFRVVMAGRQSGKTMVGIAEICIDAMTAKHINWWVCPSYKVKDRAWRGLLDFIPKEAIEKLRNDELKITLINGSEIRVTSADAEGALVSESLDFAVCDEAGQWKEDAWYRGISPMFAARAHARALLIGTPRGKNWFQRLWLKGNGSNKDPEYDSFHWKSEDSPYISQSFLAEQRRNIPQDTYRQEYEADPLDDASAVFRNVRACIRTMPVEPDRFSVLGVDLARKIDFTVIIGMNGARQVFAMDRFQDAWPEQKRRIVSAAFRANARVVMDTTTHGDVLVEELRQHGIQCEEYVFSSQSKQRLIDNLRVAIEQGTISFPNDPTLIDELEAYQYEYDDDSRKYQFSAPEGRHDDTVIALALATWGQRGMMAMPSSGSPTSYLRRGGESYVQKRSA